MFGTVSTNAAPAGTAFSFGIPVSSQAQPGFGGFGTTAKSTSSFGFGTLNSTTVTSQPGSTFGGFGQNSGFGFNANSQAVPTIGISQPSTGLGGVQPSTGLGPGAPSQLSFGLGLLGNTQTSGSTLTQTNPLGTAGLGLGLSVGQTPQTTFSFGPATSSAATSTGLSVQTATSNSATDGTTRPVSPRSMEVPPELVTLVKSLEAHIKQQRLDSKSFAATVSCQNQSAHEVEFTRLRQILSTAKRNLADISRQATALKQLTLEDANTVEIPQRLKDVQPGTPLPYDAPLDYYVGLVTGFEKQLHEQRQVINQLQLLLQCELTDNRGLSQKDIIQLVSSMHKTFVSLATSLFHTQELVQKRKQQYVALLRQPGKKFVDPFRSIEASLPPLKRIHEDPGPTNLAGPWPRSDGRLPLGLQSFSGAASKSSTVDSTLRGTLGLSIREQQTPVLPPWGVGLGGALLPNRPLLSSPDPNLNKISDRTKRNRQVADDMMLSKKGLD